MQIALLRSALLVLATAGLTACSDHGGNGSGAKGTAPTSPADGSSSMPASHEVLVLRTHMHRFDGTVLPGSLVGGAPFCVHGKVHHAFGSPKIGFPAVNEITCSGSVLRIGFGPRPEQMNKRIQTSYWRGVGGETAAKV